MLLGSVVDSGSLLTLPDEDVQPCAYTKVFAFLKYALSDKYGYSEIFWQKFYLR